MGQPELLRVVFTVLFAGITLTCVARLLDGSHRDSYPARHDDVGHAVMSAGMIAMVLSWTGLLPTPVWVLLFGGQAAFFAVVLMRDQPADPPRNWEHIHHMVGSIGMLYMVITINSMAATMSPLAASFGIYFVAYAGWSGLRALQPVRVTAGGVLARPLLVHGCRALAGGGMAYLLLAS
ncbi:MAG TPA: DUF5134 domain-containing protein [Pseudonocardiaceae bacterium]|jgi:hypothetical protein|nr:DUF5134 domain-containing protein [Pseudonocardiaceae bacterium]